MGHDFFTIGAPTMNLCLIPSGLPKHLATQLPRHMVWLAIISLYSWACSYFLVVQTGWYPHCLICFEIYTRLGFSTHLHHRFSHKYPLAINHGKVPSTLTTIGIIEELSSGNQTWQLEMRNPKTWLFWWKTHLKIRELSGTPGPTSVVEPSQHAWRPAKGIKRCTLVHRAVLYCAKKTKYFNILRAGGAGALYWARLLKFNVVHEHFV